MQAYTATIQSADVTLRIRRIGLGDIGVALRKGLADFMAHPRFGLFFGAIYGLGGVFMFAAFRWLDMPWLIVPVAIGFPLIGPFIAVGLYEISRLSERGEPITWNAILRRVFAQRERQLSWMAFVVLFVFWVWIYQVRLLFALFLGYKAPGTLEALGHIVATTPEGLGFLAVGTVVGTVLATVLFSITVIAMPLLLEREVDFVTAMITSIRTVFDNPVPMLAFGAIAGGSAILALVPLFLGLLVVLPVLGHATWHVFRTVIDIGTPPAGPAV